MYGKEILGIKFKSKFILVIIYKPESTFFRIRQKIDVEHVVHTEKGCIATLLVFDTPSIFFSLSPILLLAVFSSIGLK